MFSDYKVEVQQLTADAIEVRWDGAEATEYEANVPNGGDFEKSLVNCVVDKKCKAYYTSIATPTLPTEAFVQKSSTGDNNVVSRQFTFIESSKLKF